MPDDEQQKLLLKPGELAERGKYMGIGPSPLAGEWVRYSAEGASKQTGWKIHVSVTTPQAQEELLKLAMKHNIGEFKAGSEKMLAKAQNPDYHQAGKTAVFYHSELGTDGKPINWDAFVAEAEKIVAKHGGPGPTVQGDRPVPGSKAVYYRNDRGPNGEKYFAAADAKQYASDNNIPQEQRFNLAGDADPFAKVQVGAVQDAPAQGRPPQAQLVPDGEAPPKMVPVQFKYSPKTPEGALEQARYALERRGVPIEQIDGLYMEPDKFRAMTPEDVMSDPKAARTKVLVESVMGESNPTRKAEALESAHKKLATARTVTDALQHMPDKPAPATPATPEQPKPQPAPAQDADKPGKAPGTFTGDEVGKMKAQQEAKIMLKQFAAEGKLGHMPTMNAAEGKTTNLLAIKVTPESLPKVQETLRAAGIETRQGVNAQGETMLRVASNSAAAADALLPPGKTPTDFPAQRPAAGQGKAVRPGGVHHLDGGLGNGRSGAGDGFVGEADGPEPTLRDRVRMKEMEAEAEAKAKAEAEAKAKAAVPQDPDAPKAQPDPEAKAKPTTPQAPDDPNAKAAAPADGADPAKPAAPADGPDGKPAPAADADGKKPAGPGVPNKLGAGLNAASVGAGAQRFMQDGTHNKIAGGGMMATGTAGAVADAKGLTGASRKLGYAGIAIGAAADGKEVYDLAKEGKTEEATEKGVGYTADTAANVATFGMAGRSVSTRLKQFKTQAEDLNAIMPLLRQAAKGEITHEELAKGIQSLRSFSEEDKNELIELIGQVSKGEISKSEYAARVTKLLASDAWDKEVEAMKASTPGQIVMNSIEISKEVSKIADLTGNISGQMKPNLSATFKEGDEPNIGKYPNLGGVVGQLRNKGYDLVPDSRDPKWTDMVVSGVPLPKYDPDKIAVAISMELSKSKSDHATSIVGNAVNAAFDGNGNKAVHGFSDTKALEAAKVELQQGYKPALDKYNAFLVSRADKKVEGQIKEAERDLENKLAEAERKSAPAREALAKLVKEAQPGTTIQQLAAQLPDDAVKDIEEYLKLKAAVSASKNGPSNTDMTIQAISADGRGVVLGASGTDAGLMQDKAKWLEARAGALGIDLKQAGITSYRDTAEAKATLGAMLTEAIEQGRVSPGGDTPAFDGKQDLLGGGATITGTPEQLVALQKELQRHGIAAIRKTDSPIGVGGDVWLELPGQTIDSLKQLAQIPDKPLLTPKGQDTLKLTRDVPPPAPPTITPQSVDRDGDGRITTQDFDTNRDGKLDANEGKAVQDAFAALKNSLDPAALKAVSQIRAVALANNVKLDQGIGEVTGGTGVSQGQVRTTAVVANR